MKYFIVLLSLISSTSLLAQIPSGTDIFVADFNFAKNKITVKSPVNITRREGYDNQPSFSKDGKSLYYVAVKEDGQSDVYSYSFSTKSTVQLSRTFESEYSPKITPDGKYYSVVRVEKDSSQRFWKYPLNGNAPEITCPDLDSIGYYNWMDESSFVFFKITEIPSLWMASTLSCDEILKAKNVGRSLQSAASGQIYFTQLIDTVRWIVCMNPATGSIKKLVTCLKGSEDFDLVGNTEIVMGQGSKLFVFSLEKSQDWKEVTDFGKDGVNNIKRISISGDLKKIAFVNDSGKP